MKKTPNTALDLQAPAFPEHSDTQYPGMTLVDYFAGESMHALRAASLSDASVRRRATSAKGERTDRHDAIAEDSYLMALAMMRARKKLREAGIL